MVGHFYLEANVNRQHPWAVADTHREDGNGEEHGLGHGSSRCKEVLGLLCAHHHCPKTPGATKAPSPPSLPECRG